MTNTNNPFGGKATGNLNSAAYELKINKYVVPTSDATPLYLNDFVKTVETATERGIPICTKAAAGNACRGVVIGFEADRIDEDITYRKANEERVVFVCDDPYIALEMQVNGTLSTTDIGKYVNFVTNGGDNVTGLSKTQVDLTSVSITSRQLKIISIVDRERNELGDYSKVNVVIHDHELQHGVTNSEENLWKRAGTVLSPFNSGDTVTPTVVQKVKTLLNVVAATGITPVSTAHCHVITPIQSSTAGDLNITAIPQIAAGGFTGQLLTVIGQDDTKTVTLDDGDGLKTDNGLSMTLGLDDIWHAMWSATSSAWVEVSRVDN